MDFSFRALSISAKNVSHRRHESVYPVCNQRRTRSKLHQNENDENVDHRDNYRKLRQPDVNCGYKNGNESEEEPLEGKVVLCSKAQESERNTSGIHAK